MSDTNPTPHDQAMFMAYLGRRAVYRATGFLIPVRIEEIHLESHFEAKLAAIDGVSLCFSKSQPPLPRVFTVGAAWGYLSVRPDSWSFSMSGCCWSLLLNEAACDAVLRLCQEKSGLDPDVLFQLADLVSEHPTVTEIPDTVPALRERIAESLRNDRLR